ncbi:MAG: hypothetical protein E7000_04300 [Coriobacteriaceae bacterium]|nr:hypothetical protein [Coriobacteriaceae bacterium]
MAWQDTQESCAVKPTEWRGVTVSTPEAPCPWCAPDARTQYIRSECDERGQNTRSFHRCLRCGGYFDNRGEAVDPSEVTYQGKRY